jgi:hypothetical protein
MRGWSNPSSRAATALYEDQIHDLAYTVLECSSGHLNLRMLNSGGGQEYKGGLPSASQLCFLLAS